MGDIDDGIGSGDLFNHSFIIAFFVLGNLKPGSRGPTAAATNKHAEDNGVLGDDCRELLLPLLFPSASGDYD